MGTKTLHIIGNGFDLHHGLKTSYKDFKTWIEMVKRREEYVEQMESFFTELNDKGENLLWSDFETAIGLPDIDNVFEQYAEANRESAHDTNQYLSYLDDNITVNYNNEITHTTPQLLAEWINSVNEDLQLKKWDRKAEIAKLPIFDEIGLFLNFNYTDTLTVVYGIDDEQIFHIHGREAVNEPLIIGHNSDIDYTEDGQMMLDELNIKKSMVKAIESLKKKYHDNLYKRLDFVERLKDVDEVVIYGHSLSDIDREYFRIIKRLIQPDAVWNFLIYTDADLLNSENLCKWLKIENIKANNITYNN